MKAVGSAPVHSLRPHGERGFEGGCWDVVHHGVKSDNRVLARGVYGSLHRQVACLATRGEPATETKDTCIVERLLARSIDEWSSFDAWR